MLTVTIDNLPGFEIKAVVGEVVGTTARQQNVFAAEILQTGTRNPQPRAQTLRRWRQDAIARMTEEAVRRGANAVVGLRFDHRNIGPEWTEICAYGTAVFAVRARS